MVVSFSMTHLGRFVEKNVDAILKQGRGSITVHFVPLVKAEVKVRDL